MSRHWPHLMHLSSSRKIDTLSLSMGTRTSGDKCLLIGFSSPFIIGMVRSRFLNINNNYYYYICQVVFALVKKFLYHWTPIYFFRLPTSLPCVILSLSLPAPPGVRPRPAVSLSHYGNLWFLILFRNHHSTIIYNHTTFIVQ